MDNTKTTILNNLVDELAGITTVAKSTRILLTPNEARQHSPYIGLIAGSEEVVVEDTTDVRYELEVNLILLKRGRDIEVMLDLVKQRLYDSTLATTIGALQIKIIGQEEVALIDADKYSSTRIAAIITYVASKASF
jgi:hypothetical protein